MRRYKAQDMNRNILFLSLLLLFTICGNSRASGRLTSDCMPTDTITTFTLPTIPSTLRTPDARAKYLIEHYWDNINFSDANYTHHPELMEQAWVNYIDILPLVSTECAIESIQRLFKQTEKSKPCLLYMSELAEKYLYEHISPMRNEEQYIAVLDVLLASSLLDETEKIRYQARRELAQRNRPGTPAIDFQYTQASGKQEMLHQLNSPYTILFIYNPDCHTCREVSEALQKVPVINHLLAGKQLVVLALYPDEEVEEWKHYSAELPTTWINACDKQQVIREKNLYDLRFLPTLYLLDKTKCVLLKDATVKAIETYLQNL